jgi:hypothetical protein
VFQARAVVTRRADDALALKWLHDATGAVTALVAAIKK